MGRSRHCQEAGFAPAIAARSSQWDFLAAMVRSGMGVIWPKAQYLSRTAEAWLALCREQLSSQQAREMAYNQGGHTFIDLILLNYFINPYLAANTVPAVIAAIIRHKP